MQCGRPDTLTGAAQAQLSVDGGEAVIYMSHEPERAPPPPAATPSRDTGDVRDVTPTPARLSAPITSEGCPHSPFDLFFSVVTFEDAVVTVNAPHCIFCAGRGEEPDPYATLEGMEAIVHGLRLRTPGE